MPFHGETGTLREASKRVRKWAEHNLITDVPIEIHVGTQDEFGYTIPNRSIKEFFEGPAYRHASSYVKAGYLSVIKKLHQVIENCIEVEVHPNFIEKDDDGDRKPDGAIDANLLIHEYRGVVNVDGQPFHIKLIFKETRNRNEGNPLYAYNLETIELSEGKSSESSTRTSATTRFAPNSSITGANLLKDFYKTGEPGKKLLKASEENEITNNSSDISTTSPLQEPDRRNSLDRDYLDAVERGVEILPPHKGMGADCVKAYEALIYTITITDPLYKAI